MNRMQKVAALNKVARLKRASAAMLLVRRGYLLKRAAKAASDDAGLDLSGEDIDEEFSRSEQPDPLADSRSVTNQVYEDYIHEQDWQGAKRRADIHDAEIERIKKMPIDVMLAQDAENMSRTEKMMKKRNPWGGTFQEDWKNKPPLSAKERGEAAMVESDKAWSQWESRNKALEDIEYKLLGLRNGIPGYRHGETNNCVSADELNQMDADALLARYLAIEGHDESMVPLFDLKTPHPGKYTPIDSLDTPSKVESGITRIPQSDIPYAIAESVRQAQEIQNSDADYDLKQYQLDQIRENLLREVPSIPKELEQFFTADIFNISTRQNTGASPASKGVSWYKNPWVLGGGVAAGVGLAGLVYALTNRKKKKQVPTPPVV